MNEYIEPNVYEIGRVRIVDPNPVDNNNIDLSKLNILVELTTEAKSRTIIASDLGSSTAYNENNKKVDEIISFIKGNQINDNTNSFTTNFSEIGNVNYKDNYESFGIQNIEIDFNSSLAPMIVIKFVDARGSMIFGQGNESKYNVFFQIPYPIFNLTIKGYFGKAVSYKLHLTNFSGAFDPSTGNFIITCHFIGYTYAFLSDMLLGYLRGIVETPKGKELLAKKNVISINQLRNLVDTIDKDISNIRNNDSDVQSLIVSQDVINKSEDIKNSINTLATSIGSAFIDKDLYNNNGIAIVKRSDLSTINSLSTFIQNLSVTVNNVNKVSGDITLKSKPDNILVKDNTTFINNLISKNNYNNENVVGKNLSYFVIYDFSDFNNKLVDFIKNLNLNIDKNKIVVNQKIKSLIESKIGFSPTIGNLFKILCAHSDVFMEMLMDLSKNIEDENANSNSERNKIAKRIFNNTDVNNNISNKIIYPFPKYVKNENGNDVESWIGDDYPNLDEVIFVENLLRGELVVQEGDTNYGKDTAEVKTGWIGVNPMDSFINSDNSNNPYLGIESGTTVDNIIKTVALRGMVYMAYSNKPSNLSISKIQDIAKLEANNLYNNITNSTIKDNISSKKDSYYNLLTKESNSFGYNNKKSGRIFVPIGNGLQYVYLNSLSTNNFYLTSKNISNSNFLVDKSDGKLLYGNTNKSSSNKDKLTPLEKNIKYIDILSNNDFSSIQTYQKPSYLENIVKNNTSEYYGSGEFGVGYKTVNIEISHNIFCNINDFNALKDKKTCGKISKNLEFVGTNSSDYFIPQIYSVEGLTKTGSVTSIFGMKKFNMVENKFNLSTDANMARLLIMLDHFYDYSELQKFFDELKNEASIIQIPKTIILFIAGIIWREKYHSDIKELYTDSEYKERGNPNSIFYTQKRYKELNNLPQSVIDKLINYLLVYCKTGGEWENIYNNLKLFSTLPVSDDSWDKIYHSFKSNNDTSIFGYSINNYSLVTYNTNTSDTNYYTLFKPSANGQTYLKQLFSEKLAFINSTWRIWEDPKNVDKFFTITNEKLSIFFNSFFTEFNKLKTENSQQNAVSDAQEQLRSVINNKFIKQNTYYTIKNIYDKWVGDSTFTDIFKTFKFIDRSYFDISNDFLLNPKAFINNMVGNFNQSLYDFISRTLTDNYMDFIPLPSYIDFSDNNAMKDMFKTFTYKDVYSNNGIVSSPTFICMYVGDKSKNLDLGNTSYFKNDGVSFEEGKMPTDLLDITNSNSLVPAILVKNMQENQSIFQIENLNQAEYTETDESLKITDAISRSGNPFAREFLGQNLYNVYAKRSYTCQVKSKGNIMIQPMSYFQLANVPMFYGAYLITRVRHSIRINSMDTFFTGVRIKYDKTPLIDTSVAFMDIIGSFSNNDIKSSSTIGNYKGVISESQKGVINSITKMNGLTISLVDGSNHVVTQDDVNYLLVLAKRESSYDPNVTNKYGFFGLYQFNNNSLNTVKVSVSEYSSDVNKQHLAALRYKYFNLSKLKSYYNNYRNKQFRGVTVTENGLAAAAHLGGSSHTKDFFNPNIKVFADANNTPLTDYFNLFT